MNTNKKGAMTVYDNWESFPGSSYSPESEQAILERECCEWVDDVAKKLLGDTGEDVDKGLSLRNPRIGTLTVMRMTQEESALAYHAPGQVTSGDGASHPNLVIRSSIVDGHEPLLHVTALCEDGSHRRQREDEAVEIAVDYMRDVFAALESEGAEMSDLGWGDFTRVCVISYGAK